MVDCFIKFLVYELKTVAQNVTENHFYIIHLFLLSENN